MCIFQSSLQTKSKSNFYSILGIEFKNEDTNDNQKSYKSLTDTEVWHHASLKSLADTEEPHHASLKSPADTEVRHPAWSNAGLLYRWEEEPWWRSWWSGQWWTALRGARSSCTEGRGTSRRIGWCRISLPVLTTWSVEGRGGHRAAVLLNTSWKRLLDMIIWEQ